MTPISLMPDNEKKTTIRKITDRLLYIININPESPLSPSDETDLISIVTQLRTLGAKNIHLNYTETDYIGALCNIIDQLKEENNQLKEHLKLPEKKERRNEPWTTKQIEHVFEYTEINNGSISLKNGETWYSVTRKFNKKFNTMRSVNSIRMIPTRYKQKYYEMICRIK